jgi:hypothetical protein
MTGKTLRPLVAAMALAAGVLVPAAAQADTLVFVKDGQVYIGDVDGSHARPLTTEANNWAWPSEADDGTVVVAGGQQRVNADGTDSDGSSEIYRLDQHGHQLGAPIPTFGSYSSPACPTYPPSSVRVSPDGQTIAYWILNCGSFDYSTYFTPASSTGLSFPHQTVGQMDYINPVWLDSSTLLVNHNGATFGPHQSLYGTIAIADDSSAGGPVELGDSDSLTSFQATVDRAGDKLAFFEDDHPDWTDGKPRTAKLLLYTTNGSALADPTLRCAVSLNAAAFPVPSHGSPSFSADGSVLAFAMDDGIHEISTANLADCASVTDKVVVPGGAMPFIGKGGQAQLPNVTPKAAFTATRFRRTVTLNASRSSDSDGRIVSYAWSFGDHRTAHGAKVRHTYRHAGRYAIRLTVKDDRGAKRTVSRVVTVR